MIAAALLPGGTTPRLARAEEAPVPAAAKRPGGATTLAPGRKPGLAEPFANLSLDERFPLAVGRALFRDPWVAAPATTTARDGLGPLFNAHACVSCHPAGGRGALEADGAPSTALLLRLLRAGEGAAPPLPDPVYGDQLQTRAIAAGGADVAHERPVAEGAVDVAYVGERGSFADGTPFALRRPEWRVVARAYGDLDPATQLSARLAPALFGVGLLEAIPDEELVARADPDDRDGDGVSGRASRLADGALGRFGWKATQPSVRLQVATALHNDLGITSVPRPEQPCTAAEVACAAAPGGGDPPAGTEITPVLLDSLTRFTATLAVAARPRAGAEELRAGAGAFAHLGCAQCHVPSSTTGDAPEHAAARQTIWPYTDLLLHDMGPGLADPVGEGGTAGAEWRTPPLWGLGRATRDPQRTSLLHDGRARSTTEAILWHGGEAARARAAFVAAPRAERDAVLEFLDSL